MAKELYCPECDTEYCGPVAHAKCNECDYVFSQWDIQKQFTINKIMEKKLWLVDPRE